MNEPKLIATNVSSVIVSQNNKWSMNAMPNNYRKKVKKFFLLVRKLGFTILDIPLWYITYCTLSFTGRILPIQFTVFWRGGRGVWKTVKCFWWGCSVSLSLARRVKLTIQNVCCPELNSQHLNVELFPQLHHISYSKIWWAKPQFCVNGFEKPSVKSGIQSLPTDQSCSY